jgi:hypothetical protein
MNLFRFPSAIPEWWLLQLSRRLRDNCRIPPIRRRYAGKKKRDHLAEGSPARSKSKQSGLPEGIKSLREWIVLDVPDDDVIEQRNLHRLRCLP